MGFAEEFRIDGFFVLKWTFSCYNVCMVMEKFIEMIY